MKTIVRGHGGEPVSDELRQYIERKLGRLDRMAHRETQATVEIRGHASRSADAASVAVISVITNGEVLRSESAGATARAAFDTVLDKLERQMVRHNERPRVRDKLPARGVPARAMAGEGPPTGGAGAAPEPGRSERDDTRDGAGPRIVRLKRFDIEPMFEEDAVARMEELGHAFFVFLNAESDRICVLYRRADGNYGLIEPAVGPGRGS